MMLCTLRKPERIPTLGNTFSWKVMDSDTNAKLSNAICDWELMEKIVREHVERYQFDTYFDFGQRNNGNLLKIFEERAQYVVNDETGGINTPDVPIMEQDEYDEYMKNPLMFNWTKGLERKVGKITFGQLEDALKAQLSYFAFAGRMQGILIDEYSVPMVQKSYALHPLEMIFSTYRGIKGFSQDMRRVPDKILEFNAAMEPSYLQTTRAVLDQPKDKYVCDLYTALLMHSIMSPKQFDKFYFTTLRKVIDMLVETDSSMYIFVEAEFMRIADFFKDVEGGHLVVHVENDDIFEVRKTVPNICLAGGMPVDLLGNATSSECSDYAKKLCDTLGSTGYIFSQNKMMSFRYDGKRENMMAVQDYVLNYRG